MLFYHWLDEHFTYVPSTPIRVRGLRWYLLLLNADCPQTTEGAAFKRVRQMPRVMKAIFGLLPFLGNKFERKQPR